MKQQKIWEDERSLMLMDSWDQHSKKKNGQIPKAMYRFKEMLMQIPAWFFTDLERTLFTFILKNKQTNKTLGELNQNYTVKKLPEASLSPWFHLHYRAVVIITAWHQQIKRQINHCNRSEDPDVNPHIYGPLIFYKDGRIVK